MRKPEVLAGLVLVVALTGSCLWSPPQADREVFNPAQASATSRDSLPSAGGPPKCPPPDAGVDIRAGPAGNEWLLPVDPGNVMAIDATVEVSEGVRAGLVQFEIQPADVPGPVVGPAGPPGPPVVWWEVAAQNLQAGTHHLTLEWDGTSEDGSAAKPGKYHLFARVHTAPVGQRTDPCDSANGTSRFGLGYFESR